MEEIKTTTVPADQTTIPEPNTTPVPLPDAPPFLIRKSPIIILGISVASAFIGFGVLLVIYFIILLLDIIAAWDLTDIFMLSLLAFAIGVIVFFATRNQVYYILSKDKLSYVSKKSITKEKDFALNQIRTVTLIQSFWAKLFGFGTLEVVFFPDNAKVYLADIAEPHMIKQAIEDRGIKQ